MHSLSQDTYLVGLRPNVGQPTDIPTNLSYYKNNRKFVWNNFRFCKNKLQLIETKRSRSGVAVKNFETEHRSSRKQPKVPCYIKTEDIQVYDAPSTKTLKSQTLILPAMAYEVSSVRDKNGLQPSFEIDVDNNKLKYHPHNPPEFYVEYFRICYERQFDSRRDYLHPNKLLGEMLKYKANNKT